MAWKPKKNIEYIGKLEKAIQEKYGQEATIDPRSLWDQDKEKEYLKQVKENAEKYYDSDSDEDKIEENGILISKKLLNKSSAVSCPICKKYLMDAKDSVFILKWDCCHKCYIQWVEEREERWLSGWRPTNAE